MGQPFHRGTLAQITSQPCHFILHYYLQQREQPDSRYILCTVSSDSHSPISEMVFNVLLLTFLIMIIPDVIRLKSA